jgi:hypothetical protein
MAKHIRKDRLRQSILNLNQWRLETQAQASKHLVPFLALIEKGVNASAFTQFEEKDDEAFFDRYFKVPGNAASPWFDPITRERRIPTHTHSNVATARKGTFRSSWNAAETRQTATGDTEWKLAPDCIDIVCRKVMTRGGKLNRPNVVDLAVWFFRQEDFPDNATASDLQQRFRQAFPLPDDSYNKLFSFIDEPPERLFAATALTDADVEEVVESTLIDTSSVAPPPPQPAPSRVPPTSKLDADDPILAEVRSVLDINSSGIIFRGCPGTGKSWYAWNIALALTNNRPDRVFRVQFHPSFGYEDFVEGYQPAESKTSGFEVVPRIFLQAAELAASSGDYVAFVIDEINRGDPARVFGEVLTYIENGWRDIPFISPYRGVETRIPRNLVLLATMNPHDRSITQLDMALLRRFDHIDITPSKEKVEEFLLAAGLDATRTSAVVEWFEQLQQLMPFGIGHTYFLGIADTAKLAAVWRYRILPFCESVLEFEPERLDHVRSSFLALQRRLGG